MFKTKHEVQTNIQLVENLHENDRLLRLPEVMELSALKRSTLYKKIQQGLFPEPVKIGARAAAWRLSELNCWMKAPMEFVGKIATQ